MKDMVAVYSIGKCGGVTGDFAVYEVGVSGEFVWHDILSVFLWRKRHGQKSAVVVCDFPRMQWCEKGSATSQF